MRRVHTLSVLIAVLALLTLGAGGVAADAPGASAVTDASDVPISPDAPDAPTQADVSTAADAPTQTTTPVECDAEASTEVVGCWNGTRYDEDLGVNQSDGLTEAELENLTHLSMARVEHLRERPFREDVPVETVTRSEFENDTPTGGNDTSGEAFRRWNDQVWKALFVVGEDESAGDEIDTVFGGAVTGFYSPSEDRIVLVVAEGEELQVSESTLAHELVHAMQDQYHDLTAPRFAGATQDGDLAVDGVVEGEAVHVEELYDARCAGNWSCLEEPDSSAGGDGPGPDFNFGILQTVLQPYSDGALYVEALVDEEGWAAVNETMARPPETTSEVIHRTPDYRTREIEFTDTATGDWETYPDQGVDGAETAGEASMFVMFWYQSLEYDYPVLEPTASARENVQIHLDAERELRTRANYNYAHEATDGWAGDELYPYRNDGDDGDTRDGYVWVTEWQTTEDATEFHETYLEMLTAHGDAPYDEGRVYAIDEGEFRGAYGVEREGTTVTITHAPEPNGVLELRPDADFDLPAENGTVNDNGTDPGDGTDTPPGDDVADDGSSAPDASADETPGFGVVAALVGLLAAVSLLVRRSRS